jgi:hypothetical protein
MDTLASDVRELCRLGVADHRRWPDRDATRRDQGVDR